MTDRKPELDQLQHAAMGLGASAGASALRSVTRLAHDGDAKAGLERIAMLSSLTERAQACMSVAAAAEAEGDARLAELGWLQALSLMNHLGEQAANHGLPAVQDEHLFSRQVAGLVH